MVLIHKKTGEIIITYNIRHSKGALAWFADEVRWVNQHQYDFVGWF